MVGSITAAPGLPSVVPDPAVVIPAVIPTAAADWNTAAAISGKNLTLCKVRACGGSNHDGGTVTVKTVSVKTMDTGAASSNHNEGCGGSVACVKLTTDGDDHLVGDMSLIVEEPAWECRDPDLITGVCGEHARIYWTDKSGLANKPVPSLSNSYYYYIRATMTHEFGHTLGLSDFSEDTTTGLGGLRAIMNDTHANPTITDEDIAQLRAIYAYHDSASH